MDKERLDAACNRATKLWGFDFPQSMVIEECAELIQVIMHRERGRASTVMVAEEMADVLITVRHLSLIIGEDVVEAALDKKLAKLERKLVTNDANYQGEK